MNRVDPSTNKPVGEFVQGTAERWIDPMAKDATVGMGSAAGEFVGIGRIGAGEGGALGAASSGSTAISGLQIVGSFVAAAAILGAFVWLLPDPYPKRPDDPLGTEHLCYRGHTFSLRPTRTNVPRSGEVSLYEVDVGDELHAYWFSDHLNRYVPFTTRAGAIGFAKNRIDSSHPPRTQPCRKKMPGNV